jgi:glycosyltransferase involved in cell wall biosynthesis
MRIALVHDDLVQWGGAERVLLGLTEAFPEAPIYTSLIDYNNSFLKEQFKGKKIVTSFMQKIPGWRRVYKALLPLYPISFEQFDFSEYDLVISHTTRFAKAIITKPGTFHICYCHTPPRFLWGFSGATSSSLSKFYQKFLRRFDQISANRVDLFLAGSKNAQSRIKQIYSKESTVLYPFIDLNRFDSTESFNGGYLLCIARLNSYKRIDLAVEVSNKLKIPLKIVGKGPDLKKLIKLAGDQVEFIRDASEEIVAELLAGCIALIVPGEEDFGLTPLEAQAMGKPVIAYAQGGMRETVIEGQTGYFFDKQNVDSIILALKKLEDHGYNKLKCLATARRFAKERFLSDLKEIINGI